LHYSISAFRATCTARAQTRNHAPQVTYMGCLGLSCKKETLFRGEVVVGTDAGVWYTEEETEVEERSGEATLGLVQVSSDAFGDFGIGGGVGLPKRKF
jgi:hypothetical protein